MPLTRLQARKRAFQAVSGCGRLAPNPAETKNSNDCVTSESENPALSCYDYSGNPLPVTEQKEPVAPESVSTTLCNQYTKPQQFLVCHDIEDAYELPSADTARQVLYLLRSAYRSTPHSVTLSDAAPQKALLDSLVATILSQATSNLNSSRAFRNLKARFPSWEAALTAGPKEIEHCITCGGLAKAKSKTIYDILAHLKIQHGECSLEFIRDMSTENAKSALCSFRGVGPKTASCVLMFALSRPEFPVDTHIRRIASRLRWMPPSYTPEKSYRLLNSILPDDVKHDLHVLLIEHGRAICKPRSPDCHKCPLVGVCSFPGTDESFRPERDYGIPGFKAENRS